MENIHGILKIQYNIQRILYTVYVTVKSTFHGNIYADFLKVLMLKFALFVVFLNF